MEKTMCNKLDIAYTTATGIFLTESFSYNDFKNIDVDDYIIESLEHVDTSAVIKLIEDSVDGILISMNEKKNHLT
jgi:hypothetical protein